MKPIVRVALIAPLALIAACTPHASTPAAPAASAPTPASVPTPPAAPAEVWFTGSYEDALVQARATNKLVFIDFNTSWCPPCRKLEKDTFSQPAVKAELAKMVSMSIDAESKAGVPLAQKFHISGYPEMLVLDPGGKEVGRISAFKPPDVFLDLIGKIRARAPR